MERHVETESRVGFQGERGAFSETAAHQMVPGNIDLIPFSNFLSLFRALADRKIDYATVPIENTLAGSVHENYDLLLKYRLPILKEATVRIVHNLIAPPKVLLSSIKYVYSHPVALQQCKRFLDKYRRKLEAVPFYDTAGSVKMVIEKNLKDSAGIAGKSCAMIYGGHILVKDIGDSHQNYTRFFLLGLRSKSKPKVQSNKVSLVFATKNRPGALVRCLNIFASKDINLTKIESRPMFGKPWEYLFYLDFLGNPSEPQISDALKKLRYTADFMLVLGFYSKAS
jgi:prephenate dehydratase